VPMVLVMSIWDDVSLLLLEPSFLPSLLSVCSLGQWPLSNQNTNALLSTTPTCSGSTPATLPRRLAPPAATVAHALPTLACPPRSKPSTPTRKILPLDSRLLRKFTVADNAIAVSSGPTSASAPSARPSRSRLESDIGTTEKGSHTRLGHQTVCFFRAGAVTLLFANIELVYLRPIVQVLLEIMVPISLLVEQPQADLAGCIK
jgi:hypothetical protein